MSEQFKVDVDDLAGLGAGTEDLAAYLGKVKSLVAAEAGPKDGWDGFMEDLKGPFISVQKSTADRYEQRQTTMYMTGNELISLANLYRNTDSKSGHHIRNALPGNAHDSYQEGDARTTATHYSTGDLPELAPPPHEEADVVEIVREKAAWVADVDDVIKALTGYSLIYDAFEKVFGNWAELSRIGKAYEKAGKGMGAAGKDFQAMSDKVTTHWEGQAADNYGDYAYSLANALEAEEPITKTVKDCLDLLVAEINKLIKTLVDYLVDELKKEVKIDNWEDALKFLAKKIPVLGTTWQIERLTKILLDVVEKAKKLVEQVQKAADLVRSVIDFFSDPVKYMSDKGQEKLNNALGNQNDSVELKRVRNDLPAATVAVGFEAFAPNSGYWGGSGRDPWKNGQ